MGGCSDIPTAQSDTDTIEARLSPLFLLAEGRTPIHDTYSLETGHSIYKLARHRTS